MADTKNYRGLTLIEQSLSENTDALIVGASSAIAQALMEALAQRGRVERIFAVSRTQPPINFSNKLHWLESDYSEQSIEQVCKQLKKGFHAKLSLLFICNGILHGDEVMPERKLESLNADKLAEVFRVNTLIPALWLGKLPQLLEKEISSVAVVFSARVGSIGDNRLGGWYSYRASKAALNMLVKTAAVECARRLPNCKLIAFHPGTTDTPLSKPFQKTVPAGKLFEPEFVAQQLLKIIANVKADGEAGYLDWAGKPIPW
ncbi:SDR family NAD(P)-dependent oxidoreductase [Porticoccaceae bacterium LTM1]|nr:SDR family NAD(P)-dependent oxidoreductase [Porticoccaceae bacterium LTM1]